MGTVPCDAPKAFALAQGFSQFGQSQSAKQWALAALTTAKPDQKAGPHLFLGNLAMQESAAKSDRQLLGQARDHFAAVLETAPTDFIAGNNLAWLLATEFGRAADAVQVVERTRGAAPVERLPITFVDTMAVVYRQAGEYNKASTLLKLALDAHPSENLLKFHLGMTLGHVNRPAEAKQLLNEALADTLSAEHAAEAKTELDRLALVETKAADEAATPATSTSTTRSN
jgi:predicted Zn-dependent protease